MKILLCTSTFQSITHGPAKFANLLLQINTLYPEHELRIITPDVVASIPDQIYKINRELPSSPFGVFWVYKDNFIYYEAAMRVKSEYDFDVLLCNNAILGWQIAKQKNRDFKTVGMLNDDEYLCRSVSGISFNKHWWIDMTRKPLEQRACKALDLVITNSKYLEAEVIKAYHLKHKKVLQIYKSIDLSDIEFKNDQRIETNEAIKILFVKNDFKRGGLSLLTKALHILKTYTFKVTVAGPLHSDRRLIQKYFEGKHNLFLDFRGQIPQREVYSEMYQGHIFCVPALREALGVANIEALAAGIPVVSSNAGGIPEVLGNGAFGWISKKGEVESLAKAIKACLLNPLIRKQKSLIGRSFVESNFSHKSMLQKIITELKACLKT